MRRLGKMTRGCELRLTERPSSLGAFGVARLTVLFLVFPGLAHANGEDQVLSSNLSAFLELCISSEPTGDADFLEGAAELGFAPAETVDAEIQSFFQTRELSLLSHSNDNERAASIFKNRTEQFLSGLDDSIPTFITHENGWVGLVNSSTVAFLQNGVPYGEAHLCSFLGYGWAEEQEVRSALARVIDSDFPEGAPGRLNEGWRYVLTGHDGSDYPYADFFVTAVKGVPDQLEPTIELSINLIRHTELIDEAEQADQ